MRFGPRRTRGSISTHRGICTDCARKISNPGMIRHIRHPTTVYRRSGRRIRFLIPCFIRRASEILACFDNISLRLAMMKWILGKGDYNLNSKSLTLCGHLWRDCASHKGFSRCRQRCSPRPWNTVYHGQSAVRPLHRTLHIALDPAPTRSSLYS